ncbi:MAG TPA: hypothetical protein VLZ03_15605, partial [Thermodesulfobacteriota bacterium]|nr:hypothetical protein [Thermodesulfobacteriota bacterium]
MENLVFLDADTHIEIRGRSFIQAQLPESIDPAYAILAGPLKESMVYVARHELKCIGRDGFTGISRVICRQAEQTHSLPIRDHHRVSFRQIGLRYETGVFVQVKAGN